MKHAYRRARPLLAALFLFVGVSASAQQAWRPFRPGMIYSFATPPVGIGVVNTFLLRVDSAYVTAGGDSVWTFNRLLRPTDGSVLAPYSGPSARKSRNNLFGARLSWAPGTSEFVLENVAEGSYQAAQAVRLRPRAAVGSSWVACTAPALTATLTSRAWQPVTGAAGSPSDSVATITLSSGTVLRLSRQYGLLAGPRWMTVGSNAAPQWQASELPATLANSPLYPATLFNFQPGDLLGYDNTPGSVGSPPCTSDYTLRAIQTRQVVGDSLIYTYRQQTRTVNRALFGCFGTPGAIVGPVRVGRLAFSLRTGRSPQYEALSLLSGEYRDVTISQGRALVAGLGIQPASGSVACFSGGARLMFQQMYPWSTGLYGTISDGGWDQSFSPQTGMGDVRTFETTLTYYSRSTPSGLVVCGSGANYAALLPTRAAQAAALATLHPNPAAEAATLTLATPARPGTALRLTDALGRAVWSAPVPTSQTTIAVPLAGQPAGLYLLHLRDVQGTSAAWKLTHE